jgi:drug/metabolite transporter (DMT)-like permease
MLDSNRQSQSLAVLVALGCTWGSSFLFIEVILEDISPIEVVAGRLFFGALTVGSFMALRRLPLRWTPSLLARISVMAALANILPFGLIAWGQEHIESGTASVLNSTVPIFTALFAAAFLPEERFTAARFAGLVLGLLGIIVLTGEDALSITDSGVLGQFAVIGAALCYGASSVYSRTLLRTNDPFSLSALQLITATVFSVPLVFVLEGGPAYSSMDAEGWLALIALGFAGTGLGYIAYLWLIEHTGSVRASLVTYIVPIVALFLGWLVLDETIGLNVIVGAALIIIGVASVMRGQAPGSERAAGEAVPLTRQQAEVQPERG